MADHLSREGGLPRFFEAVARRAFVAEPAQLQALPGAGRVRNLDTSVPFNAADMARLSSQARAPPDMLWLSRVLPAIVCLQAATRGWLARRARKCVQNTPGSSPEEFGAFFGRWAPAIKCAYGRLEWAYFFPMDEGERLFVRVLALSLDIPYFLACAVTGMLLALDAADRSLLPTICRMKSRLSNRLRRSARDHPLTADRWKD